MRRACISLAALTVMAACDEPVAVAGAPPAIEMAATAAIPTNVLGATVTVRALRASEIAVRYRPATSSGPEEETPPVVVIDGEATVPVFGLHANQAYLFRAVARGRGGVVSSAAMELTTGTLPEDMPRYETEGTNPTPGYIAFSAGAYGIVIDNDGRVVWYHRLARAGHLNFQPQPTGRYVVGASTAEPGGPFVELNVLGTVTRTLACTGGEATRFHDLIAEPNGDYWLLCDEVRTMDLSGVGGVAGATVTGTVIQHVGAGGERLFRWSAFDHFAITDLPAEGRAGAAVNWTHGNAIDLDADGNLLVSFRSLDELSKVDSRTGAVVWRMGGARSDFTFGGAGEPGYSRQHGLRSAGAGQLTILDNVGSGVRSRGERYAYDASARTVSLVSSYIPNQPVLGLLGGSTQALPGGRVLISYGSGGRVEEYDASGQMVWRIKGNAGYVFRATRIASLHAPIPY